MVDYGIGKHVQRELFRERGLRPPGLSVERCGFAAFVFRRREAQAEVHGGQTRTAISAVLIVAACGGLAQGAEADPSYEEVVFNFLRNGILGFDEAELRKALVDPLRLLDGREHELDATLRTLRRRQADDRVEINIESIFFIETREDLKGLFEYWLRKYPDTAGREVRKNKAGDVDVEKTCMKWKLLLRQDKDFVKCVFGMRTRPKGERQKARVSFLFLLCQRIDGRWRIVGLDDG